MNFTLFRISLFVAGTALSLAAYTPARAQAPITGGTHTGSAGTNGTRQAPGGGAGGNGDTFASITYTQLISGGAFTGGSGGTGGGNGGNGVLVSGASNVEITTATSIPTFTGGNAAKGAGGKGSNPAGGETTVSGSIGGTGGNGFLISGPSTVNITGGIFTGATGANGGNGGNGQFDGLIYPGGYPGGDGSTGGTGGRAGTGLSVSGGGTVDITGGIFAGGNGGNAGNGGNGAGADNGAGGNGGNGGMGGMGGDGLFASGSGTVIDVSGGTFLAGGAGAAGAAGVGAGGAAGYSHGMNGTAGAMGTTGYDIVVENGATIDIIVDKPSDFSFTNGIITATLADGDHFSATADIGAGGGHIVGTSAVPEPAFYQMSVLVILGGIGMLRMRRKRDEASA